MKNSSDKRIALIYCRVSSERQKNEGHGLDSQEHRCREYAQFNDFDVEKVFKDSFSGGGDFMNRPAMAEMLSYIDKKPFVQYTIIFDDLKRFARDVQFHIKLRIALKARNVTPKCLNFNFEDTPEGEYVETILAAGAELERKQNKRQVIQKQQARLEAGYWPFGSAAGYAQVKTPGHGKLLVPVEPKASIIREAFEGYANDRFLEQIDVQKFLQERDYFGDGSRVYLHLVRRILTRPIYAGYIEYPDWEVSRRKGQHEAIVSPEVFERVQDKLNGRSLIRTRKDYTEVFPLRGFVRCSKCNEQLTASESTGHKGIKYGYYRCKNRGCSERTKSIKKEDIETSFIEYLKTIQPSKKVIALAKAVIEDVYEKRLSQVEGRLNRIEKDITVIDVEVNALVTQITRTDKSALVGVYEAKIEELNTKKLLLVEKRNNTVTGPVSVGTAYDMIMEYLKNPANLWLTGNLDDKRRVLKLVFADGYTFDREKAVGTAKMSVLYELFQQFGATKYQDVEMGRIELPSE